MTRRALLLLSLLLAGCLNFDQPRVTPEHRQLKNRAAIVVLLDAAPRVARIALQPTKSTHGTAALPGWDPVAAITPYLAGRLRGMGLTVVPLDYQADDYAAVYASSQAYPNPSLVHAPLRALAAGKDIDMLVIVYRQAERDFVGESIENLVGYGVVQHEGGGTHAYASVKLEALDVDNGSVIGFADGLSQTPLTADAWRDGYASDGAIDIDASAAPVLNANLTTALQAAVLTAAQETGLSH